MGDRGHAIPIVQIRLPNGLVARDLIALNRLGKHFCQAWTVQPSLGARNLLQLAHAFKPRIGLSTT